MKTHRRESKVAYSEFGATDACVASARHFADAVLADWGYSEPLVLIVVSELATNAVRHSGTPFSVRLTGEPAAVLVEVSDTSSELPRRIAPATTSLGSRGLMIVDHVAESWGIEIHPRGGKCVWVRVPRGASDSPAHSWYRRPSTRH
jgi:signal transduction histidine kinase